MGTMNGCTKFHCNPSNNQMTDQTTAPPHNPLSHTTILATHAQTHTHTQNTPFRNWIWESVVADFCNVIKQMIPHSHLPHALIGQLCRGDKALFWFLSPALFLCLLQRFVLHSSCLQPSATPRMSSGRDRLKMCVIPIFKWHHVSASF